jgi:hypothetical protein
MDYYDNKLSRSGGSLKACGWSLIGIILLLMATLFTSCKTIQYVPVPEYHHDSIYITKVQHDSIFQHDSVYVKEYTKGDTVYLETTKWQTKYKEVYLCDTMFVEKTDSVRVPYPIEKKLGLKDRAFLYLGKVFPFFFVFCVIMLFIFFHRKR